MLAKKILLSVALLFAGALAILAAQNNVFRRSAITIWGRHAKMIFVTESMPSSSAANPSNPNLVTIFNNLAAPFPKGEYWCCTGYNVMGPAQGEQWMAASFTSHADHTLTTIEVAAGYSQGKTNGVVLSLNEDNHGVPGKPIKTWSVSGLPRFGTCCGLAVKSDNAGIPLSAGLRYWIVLSTNSNELDTVDGWNVVDTNQVDPVTVATYPGNKNKWEAFPATPGLAFAIKGTN